MILECKDGHFAVIDVALVIAGELRRDIRAIACGVSFLRVHRMTHCRRCIGATVLGYRYLVLFLFAVDTGKYSRLPGLPNVWRRDCGLDIAPKAGACVSTRVLTISGRCPSAGAENAHRVKTAACRRSSRSPRSPP